METSAVSAIETASPAIVRVEARRRYPLSGVVFAEGVVVTTSRAVEREEDITVGLADGNAHPATLVGRDPGTDLAVLRLENVSLTPPTWREADGLKVGEPIVMAARPGGAVRATAGILSVMEGSWRTPSGSLVDHLLQSDAVTFPGFSGGPLLTLAGEVLGINSSALSRTLALTLPAKTVRRVTETLLAHGRMRRGHLGVGIQPVRLPAALQGELGQKTGLLVISVQPGSAAEVSGLVMGDTLLSLEGQPLRHPGDLQAGLGEDRIGAQIPVRVLRGGSVQEVMVTIGERS